MKIKLDKIKTGNKNNSINIIFRGNSFRSSIEDQISCLNSIVDMIIKPILKNGFTINLVQMTYKNQYDYIISNELQKRINQEVNYIYSPLDDSKIRSQPESFYEVLKYIKKSNMSSLVIRPDLLLKKEINSNRFFDDVFLFQWNYFHDYKIREMPDQIHFIGNAIVDNLIEAADGNLNKMSILPNGKGRGSLHNLYNFSFDSLPKKRISYIYEFNLTDDDFEGSYCKLRGNSLRSKVNDHIFDYKRTK